MSSIRWNKPKDSSEAIEQYAAMSSASSLQFGRLNSTLQQCLASGSRIQDYMLPGRFVDDIRIECPEDYDLLCHLKSEDFRKISPWRIKQVVSFSSLEEDFLTPYRSQYANVPRGTR